MNKTEYKNMCDAIEKMVELELIFNQSTFYGAIKNWIKGDDFCQMFSRLYPFYHEILYRNRNSRDIIKEYLNRKKDQADTFNIYVKIEGGLQLGIITCYRTGQWQSDDDFVLNFELGYEDFNDKENVPFVTFESYEDFKHTNQVDNYTNQE
tara:strand:+ start:45 stop:497 length:453 start_codon:yes stop_codon:yes gene_type:complete